jgi:hypothetical protein
VWMEYGNLGGGWAVAPRVVLLLLRIVLKIENIQNQYQRKGLQLAAAMNS